MRLARAVCIAVAVAGSSAAPFAACAQSSAVTVPGTAASIDDSPAVKRLTELVAVVNTGDATAMRAYLEANSISRTGSWDRFLLQIMLDLHRLSHGLDLVRVETIGQQQFQPQLRGYSVAILRNAAVSLRPSISSSCPGRFMTGAS